MSMSVKELKQYIRSRGLSFAGCVEKSDLQEKANEASLLESFNCSICFQDEFFRATMPCCGTAESSMIFCRRCVEIICDGGVGRCPSCRGYIQIEDGTVRVSENKGQCHMCQQQKVLLDRGLCDACLLGSRYRFTYECNRCHGRQCIPHPMWRYQESPDVPGTSTWACHQSCGDYTNWTIVPEDAAQVPAEECPTTWGRREEWLAQIRARSQNERARAAD